MDVERDDENLPYPTPQLLDLNCPDPGIEFTR